MSSRPCRAYTKETNQNLHEEGVRFALKVGKEYGHERLDMPGRLVLMSYAALRDYQFSLSKIHWFVAAFDEAQNIKNPNALQTRAAKALNADFRILATGTPVENSLKDFGALLILLHQGYWEHGKILELLMLYLYYDKRMIPM